MKPPKVDDLGPKRPKKIGQCIHMYSNFHRTQLCEHNCFAWWIGGMLLLDQVMTKNVQLPESLLPYS